MQNAELVLSEFQNDPNLYFEKALGATPEEYQRRINNTIARNQRTAISACHDVGKTWDIARIILWFASCFPFSKTICTAPTFNQVKNIMWSEINSAHGKSKAPLGGVMLQTEWKLAPDWFVLGFTSRNEANMGVGQGTSSSFQGFHAEGGILIVFDEATGVPKAIWDMAEGMLTQAFVKFVAIGNPTSRVAEFFQCFRDPQWAKEKLSCFDSPNLIANGITNLGKLEAELDLLKSMADAEVLSRLQSYKVVRPHLLSTAWVMGRALKWGIKHPLFVSKVLGEFPEESDDTLIPLHVVEEAVFRYETKEVKFLEGQRKTLGVDVARFGSDSTVLTRLNGHEFVTKKVLVKRDTTEVTGAVIEHTREFGIPDVIVVDETGIGSGVVDQLNEYRRSNLEWGQVEIRGVQFGAGAKCEREDCYHTHDCDKAKYVNLKARMFDLLAQDLRRSLSLPPEDVYVDELPTILYSHDSKGRMDIESKDEYKKRTGRDSPDHADSLALANFGHYDEMSLGKYGDAHLETSKPFASSLNSGVEY